MNKQKIEKDQEVWAVIDFKYGVVGLYATRQLARKACKLGIGLDSGYTGAVRCMVVQQSVSYILIQSKNHKSVKAFGVPEYGAEQV